MKVKIIPPSPDCMSEVMDIAEGVFCENCHDRIYLKKDVWACVCGLTMSEAHVLEAQRVAEVRNATKGPLPQSMIDDIVARAKAAREAGHSCDIRSDLGYISVHLYPDTDYFFDRENEVQSLLDEVPDEVDAEDYILATSQNW